MIMYLRTWAQTLTENTKIVINCPFCAVWKGNKQYEA